MHERTVRNCAPLMLLAVLLSACAPAMPTPDLNAQMTQAVQTALVSIQSTQTAAANPTAGSPGTGTVAPAELTPTAVQTPPELASTFTTQLLSSSVTPHTYISDNCEYLKAKWSSTNAAPGTVVMVIMIHGITKGAPDAGRSMDMSGQDFNQLVNDLHEAGFEAIYTQELVDFLYSNARIPQRSVLLVQDDRHHAGNFNDWFRPLWDKWGWPVVSGWIGVDGAQDPYLQENLPFAQEGWVDYQAHGVVHNINMSDSSTDEFLTGELEGSITNMQALFHKTPVAIIWPGGDFGVRPAQFARKFGFQLGFTINPRGPVMYNWIPLADQPDPRTPAYIPEGPVNDPLMTLPRYWDTDARSHIDTVRQIGNQAAEYAAQQKPVELAYYDSVCAPNYGPMP